MSVKSKRRLKSLEVRRAVNGVTVRHETESVKRHGTKSGMAFQPDYEPAQEHAFNDHAAAHAHVTKHLAQLFGHDEADEDPAEEAAETPAEERKEQKSPERTSHVAAFKHLRKGGHFN